MFEELKMYEELKKPFERIHFRPKTCYNGKVLLLAYLDSRDVMDRLDEAVEAGNWECDYKKVKNNLYCGICIDGKWKWDCGVESNMDAEKGESSDAFKRAAVKWGIGRYLYTLPKMQVMINPKGDNYIKIRDKATGEDLKGYYNNPTLPDWALPKPDKQTIIDKINEFVLTIPKGATVSKEEAKFLQELDKYPVNVLQNSFNKLKERYGK